MENTEAVNLQSAQPSDAAVPTVESSDVSSPEERAPRNLELDLAHLVVHLIQCQHCSRPLNTPLRLPCGNSICKSCLPPARPRTGITYPVAEGREEGFTCYWEGTSSCAGDHCVGDCGTDVVLSNVATLFQEELAFSMPGTEHTEVQQNNEGRSLRWLTDRKDEAKPEFQTAHVGNLSWLQGLYLLAWEGRYPYSACNVTYHESPTGQNFDSQDATRFQKLRDRLRGELDCQVCYSLILDPLTTPCGHTFCRKCVVRVLDHTDLCPVCRRKVGMPSTIQAEPLNRTLARIINYFFQEQIASRRETVALDEVGTDHEKNLPLFVCTMSFPTMPTFLHIFEARYRLMIRRVVENGDGKFGMVMCNRRGRPQGDELGSVPFMQYGTLLMVERYELLPDGRSLVIATGISRFRVLEAGELDGYHVARTERVDDLNLADEERLEATETAAAAIPDPSLGPNAELPLDYLSTQELLILSRDFIRKQRQAGAPWLHPRVMLAYGPVPTDAARFPWWFASILPISEEEKYPILSARSVRERLKISARWARELEARDWSARSSLNSVLWLAVPLLVFCIIPLALSFKPFYAILTSLTPNVLTSFTPFSFSISVSFGGAQPMLAENNNQIHNQHEQIGHSEGNNETYIPQTLVIGAFLAIFLTQVGVNFLQVVRTGRRRRRAFELQFPQPLPQRDHGPNGEQ